MSTKLFVGNLSFDTTENDLQDAFAAFGTVAESNLMMDRATGRPRGFAFVTMSTPEEAQKAIDGLNGKDLGGRALTVSMALWRTQELGMKGKGLGTSGRQLIAEVATVKSLNISSSRRAAPARSGAVLGCTPTRESRPIE
jgi:RNA recognition motif-containing protein